MTDTTVTATVFAKTDLGRTRDHNEDAFLVADLSAGRSSHHSTVVNYKVGARGLLITAGRSSPVTRSYSA